MCNLWPLLCYVIFSLSFTFYSTVSPECPMMKLTFLIEVEKSQQVTHSAAHPFWKCLAHFNECKAFCEWRICRKIWVTAGTVVQLPMHTTIHKKTPYVQGMFHCTEWNLFLCLQNFKYLDRMGQSPIWRQTTDSCSKEVSRS